MVGKKICSKNSSKLYISGGIIRNQPKNFVKNYSSQTLLKRMANENDLIGPILFLSDHSKYITGQNLIVDGGFSI